MVCVRGFSHDENWTCTLHTTGAKKSRVPRRAAQLSKLVGRQPLPNGRHGKRHARQVQTAWHRQVLALKRMHACGSCQYVCAFVGPTRPRSGFRSVRLSSCAHPTLSIPSTTRGACAGGTLSYTTTREVHDFVNGSSSLTERGDVHKRAGMAFIPRPLVSTDTADSSISGLSLASSQGTWTAPGSAQISYCTRSRTSTSTCGVPDCRICSYS